MIPSLGFLPASPSQAILLATVQPSRTKRIAGNIQPATRTGGKKYADPRARPGLNLEH